MPGSRAWNRPSHPPARPYILGRCLVDKVAACTRRSARLCSRPRIRADAFIAQWIIVRCALNDGIADPRTDADQAAARAVAAERRDAYIRGHQLAEICTTAGLTQADLAHAPGVSQARISKIEHGEISGIDIVRAYVTALGGTIELVATFGDRTWKVA
jgi:DNA-binding XRE family transcriptional regulator